MTIGEWVTNALITVANGELGSGPAATAAFRSTDQTPGGVMQVHAADGRSQPMQTAVPAELARAVEILTRRIEQDDNRDKTVGALVERLDALVHADNTMTEMSSRAAEVDRRDRDFLAVAERLAAGDRANEQRLAVLTSAVAALASRFDGSTGPSHSGVSTSDLAGAILPHRQVIDGLTPRNGGTAYEARPETAVENLSGNAISVPERVAVPPLPALDFERLHEKAIDNTRRLFSDDPEVVPKNGLMSRLFGA